MFHILVAQIKILPIKSVSPTPTWVEFFNLSILNIFMLIGAFYYFLNIYLYASASDFLSLKVQMGQGCMYVLNLLVELFLSQFT